MNLLAHPLENRPRRAPSAKWLAAALAAALLPLVAAVVLLGSAASGRPIVGPRSAPALARKLTVTWGLGLLVIALLQGASAVLAGMSVTNPTDVLIRTLGALALEGFIFAGTRTFAHPR